MDKLKSVKGITLIALTITLLILGVITSILVYNTKNSIDLRSYKSLENDIEILNGKVATYYIQNNELPILKDESGNNIIYGSFVYRNEELYPNDNSVYYVIDIGELKGITLNYGESYKKIKSKDDTLKIENSDVYIINEQSHRIYYADGIRVGGTIYYTIGTDNDLTLYNAEISVILKYKENSDTSISKTLIGTVDASSNISEKIEGYALIREDQFTSLDDISWTNVSGAEQDYFTHDFVITQSGTYMLYIKSNNNKYVRSEKISVSINSGS